MEFVGFTAISSPQPQSQSIRRSNGEMVHTDGEGASSSRVGSMEPNNTESGPSTPEKQEYFNKLREAVAPSRTDLTS